MSTLPPLLSIDRLSLQNRKGERVVDDVTIAIPAGVMTALVGESGSGKTMIARSIMGLLPPGIRVNAGRIEFGKENLLNNSNRRMRVLRGDSIGLVFQEPMVSLNPAMTVGAQMAEGLRLHTDLKRSEIRKRCVDMLERVKIPEPELCLSAYPHQFSGGMRQRIMVASVMLLRPKLLIADEPTTALDSVVEREVLELISELAEDFNTAVLLITHNLGLVARYARETAVLYRGRLIEHGASSQVLNAPRSDYTRRLLRAVPGRSGAPAISGENPVIISARELTLCHRGSRTVIGHGKEKKAVSDASIDIRAGEVLALVGGSGCGKTTLGRAVLGVHPCTGGVVRFYGKDISTMGRKEYREYRLSCQMIFQDPFASLDPRVRIGDTLMEPLRHEKGLTLVQRRHRVAEILKEVGLEDMWQRRPHELSGGQRQRVAIARAIVRRPQFIVADEPVSALDMTIQQQILRLLIELQKKHRFACLFISHDLAAVGQVADRIVVMHEGKVIESGSRDDILDNPRCDYTRLLLQSSPSLGLTGELT